MLKPFFNLFVVAIISYLLALCTIHTSPSYWVSQHPSAIIYTQSDWILGKAPNP